MSPHEVEKELDSFVVLYDTREQPGEKLDSRLQSMGVPVERQKLNYGDYSAKTEHFDLRKVAVVERKMGIDELAMCFTRERARFEREFCRAMADGARVYLLVEGMSWDVLLSDDSFRMRSRTRMTRKAFTASLLAFTARYKLVPVFCNDSNTGKIIKEILYRELKEVICKKDELGG